MSDKKLVIHAKRYTNDTSVVSARLPKDMIKDIDDIAKQTGRNRNEIIMLCLEFAMDHLEIDTERKEE